MTTQHTPGPWHKGIGNGEGFVFSDSGRTRLEEGGTTLYSVAQVNRGWNDLEDEANARLISAAPELLAALEGLLNALPSATTHPAIKAARAAIAKATGEA